MTPSVLQGLKELIYWQLPGYLIAHSNKESFGYSIAKCMNYDEVI